MCIGSFFVLILNCFAFFGQNDHIVKEYKVEMINFVIKKTCLQHRQQRAVTIFATTFDQTDTLPKTLHQTL
jgi:hypothetical protein